MTWISRVGHQMGDEGLERRSRPGSRSSRRTAAHRAAGTANSSTASTVRRRRHHHWLPIRMRRSSGTLRARPNRFCRFHRGVEQPLPLPLVEPVAIDQPLFLDPGLDPVGLRRNRSSRCSRHPRLKPGADIFGRLDRHAVARQHVEMRGPGKRPATAAFIASSVAATRLHSPQPHLIRRLVKVTCGLSPKRLRMR